MKQTLYPKTSRVSPQRIQLTEKLDGSNMGIFVYDSELYVAQRSNIYSMTECFTLNKDDLYKGLTDWLTLYGEALKETMYEGACIFGEWIGMGKLKYDFKNPFHMFAKANVKLLIDGTFEAYNIYYDRVLFIYPFLEQKIPEYISIVPLVAEVSEVSIDILDSIYDTYTEKVGRPVEGFVVIHSKDSIKKYVRMKSGSIEKHFW